MGKYWTRFILPACAACGGYFIFEGEERTVLFIASIAVGLSLYVVREFDREFYGAIEVLFSGFALWDAAGKGRGAFNQDYNMDFQTYQWMVILLQTGGAIYVLIRGVDNCKAFKIASKLRCKNTSFIARGPTPPVL